MSHFVNHCLDLLFPPHCVSCGQRLLPRTASRFCWLCTEKIHYLRSPFCRICGRELHTEPASNSLCGDCLKKPPPFSVARSIVWYDEVVRDLMLRLKFGNDTTVLPGISQIIVNFDGRLFSDVDWIVPVPLHHARLRKRGINQAVVLARLIFHNRSRLLRTDILVRTRYTEPQTKLDGAERRRNLRGAFETNKSQEIAGAVVCLVDDVFTTGTTVNECSRTMRKSGVGEVRVLTLARVKIRR